MTATILVLILSILVLGLGTRLARGALEASDHLPLPSGDLPPVTVVKPVYRVDAWSREAFLSWIEQDYPGEVQLVFSLQDPEDPALALLEELRPGRSFEVLVNPIRPGYGGKTSNLWHGIEVARHPLLVFSDADIVAPPTALRALVGRLQAGNDVVACPVRTHRAGNLWARLYAFAWNAGLLGVATPALHHRLGVWLPGGTVGLTRAALDRLGGIEALAAWVAEDVAMSRLAKDLGFRVDMGPAVSSPMGAMDFRAFLHKLERGHLMHLLESRRSGAAYLLGMGAAHLAPLVAVTGSLVAIASALTSLEATPPVWATAAYLGLILVGFRAMAAGRFEALATGRERMAWDLLVLDFFALATMPLALVRRKVTWGGVTWKVGRGGRMQAAG